MTSSPPNDGEPDGVVRPMMRDIAIGRPEDSHHAYTTMQTHAGLILVDALNGAGRPVHLVYELSHEVGLEPHLIVAGVDILVDGVVAAAPTWCRLLFGPTRPASYADHIASGYRKAPQ